MLSIRARELVAFLRAQGFAEERQSGSHTTLVHVERGTVTVPVHSGVDLGRGLAVRILKDAGFSVGDYLRLRLGGGAAGEVRGARVWARRGLSGSGGVAVSGGIVGWVWAWCRGYAVSWM